jgi:curli biogenesis system outer membrane secretion channel CsgG
MKKIRLAVVLIIQGALCQAQTAGTLDAAIVESVEYLSTRIPSNSKLAILNVSAPNTALSDYIIDGLIINVVNNSNFIVIDRRNLEMLQQELNFQMSGEVSTELALSIGRMFGVQSIISGHIEQIGSMYRLQIQAIEVTTARVQGMQNFRIADDPMLPILLGQKRSLSRSVEQEIQIVALDTAITTMADYLTPRIPRNSKMVVLNITSGSDALSNYIIDTLTAHFVNTDIFVVVDRRNLEMLRQEMNFQQSGNVDERTAQAIGRKLGAQTIISGRIETLGDMYRFQLQATHVETAIIQGIQGIIIKRDAVLASLTGRQPKARLVNEDWKYRRLYVGAYPAVTMQFYNTADTAFEGNTAENSLSVDWTAYLSVQINQYFALQTEIVFTSGSFGVSHNKDAYDEYNNFLYSYNTTEIFTTRSLLLPVLAKLTLKPGVFSINVLGGIYFTIPLGNMEWSDSFQGTVQPSAYTNSPLGFTAGAGVGIKIGPGILFTSVRYWGDFFAIKIEDMNIYRGNMVSVGIGYEIGFFNMK